ncbi:MAG: hypothetical protein PVH77_10365 [Phycisphaerales bacterium]
MKYGIILIIICLFIFPAQAKYGGGTGEPSDPYLISTAEDLILLGESPEDYDKHFILTADIDLDPNLPGGQVFTDALIAQDPDGLVSRHMGFSFKGVLDGQGHTIAHLHIEGEDGYDTGLFGSLSGIVKDLTLTDVVISGSPCGAIAGINSGGIILRCRVTGQLSGIEQVGGLVGTNWDGSLVECEAQVQVTGDEIVGGIIGSCLSFSSESTMICCEVQAEVTGLRNVGGLIGRGEEVRIIECRSSGTVIGVDNVGGLIGYSYLNTVIFRSSANCDIAAEQNAGGLAGGVIWNDGLFSIDCYARGSIAGSVVGGLVGEYSDIHAINCYSAYEIIPLEAEGNDTFVGGLFGNIFPPILPRRRLAIGCFWDAELSGVSVSNGLDLPG